MKVLYITGAIPDHTSSGGYVHINKFPNSETLDVSCVNSFFWNLGKPWKFLNYILAVKKSCKISTKYDVIHCTYEDNYFFPLIWECKCKMVGTVHLDITKKYNFFKKIILNYVLNKLDLIIVLSKDQEILMRKLGYNCIYIPHGYNKPNFKYKDMSSCLNINKINIFFSGTTYRDIDLLEKIVKEMENNGEIVFHILSQKGENKNRFLKYKNAKLYDRLEDDDYFSLLTDCDYNFLPLTFATANNTLLEAHTLGKISILPASGGILDYAAPDDILYNNENELIDFFSKIRKNPELINKQIKNFAEDFTWDSVYKKLLVVYSNLVKGDN